MADTTLASMLLNNVTRSFMVSLVELLDYDASNDQYVGHRIFPHVGIWDIDEDANAVVRAYLGTDDEWLFWLDADMGFAPDVLEQLRATADPQLRPIVGALCQIRTLDERDGMNGYITGQKPAIMNLDAAGGFEAMLDPPARSLVQCTATGSACVIIHRSVFERVATEFGETWYSRMPMPVGTKRYTPDVSFYLRAGLVGFPVMVNTAVRTNHEKLEWLS